MDQQALVNRVLALCQQAGEAILQVYNHSDGFDVDTKSDNSPVTAADLAAHAILEPGLTALLEGVPVLSEEGELPPFEQRQQWQRYWIVDPLDGTREFVNRNGEFTVNVALIDDQRPVLGVVHVPVTGISYSGVIDLDNAQAQAFKYPAGAPDEKLPIHTRGLDELKQQPMVVVASRNHGAREVESLMQRVSRRLGPVRTDSIGSSLKLCLIAEGIADLYPRLAPTCEWDTAAAQAVVEAAGGSVLDDQLQPLRYNTKDSLLNPYFYVIGDRQQDWYELLELASGSQ